MTDTRWGMTPDVPKALMLARRQLAELVCDAVNLEGIPFTLPEIQTLLQGVTVGGHRLSDQKIALNQREAWTQLFAWVEAGALGLTREKACALHALAAREDALEWGRFRSGGVLIAGTAFTPPPASDLSGLFDDMVASLDTMADIYDQAIHIFLTMARCQFFYDVNKRMGRFLMNGHLLAQGYPAINLPASRRLEFNHLMLDFYPLGDESAMNAFMRSCLDPRIIDIMREK